MTTGTKRKRLPSHGYRRALATVAFAALALLCMPIRSLAAVTVALTPTFQIISPGTDFTVGVDITAAGTAFNAYELVLGYDPKVLTLLPTSPLTAQQGCLMTGVCSTACGTTFHRFAASGDSITVNNVMLCSAIAVTGPGRIYQLRFHAGLTPTTTQIYLRHGAFYNDGIVITPLIGLSKTSIGIGVGLGVGSPAAGLPHPLRVEPNPSFGSVRIVSDDDAAGVVDEINVLDLLGRVVRRIGPTSLAPRASIVWDGRDARGARVPAGLYLVRIRRAGQVQNTRVMLLQ